MYTRKTRTILSKVSNLFTNYNDLDTIENVHLRGAMFGFYKKGSNVQMINDRWPDKGLQLMKPGKLLQMVTKGYDVGDKPIEIAVNKLKGYIAMYGDEHGEGVEAPNFSVVSGQMIGFYYLEHQYAAYNSGSNLEGSCMRHEHCLPYFKIYEENPDTISLLVLRNTSNLIVARALLWFDGTDTYMDTIYHSTDAFREQMIGYANRHGIYYKAQQSCHYVAFDMLNGERVKPNVLNIKLNVSKNWQMPWLDTMFTGYFKDGDFYLTNCANHDMGTEDVYILRNTGGGILEDEVEEVKADKLLHIDVAFTLLYGADRSARVSNFITTTPKLLEDLDMLRRDWNGFLSEMIKRPHHNFNNNSEYRKYFLNEVEEEDDDDDHEGEVWSDWHGEWIDEDDSVYCDAYGDYIRWDVSVEVRGSYYHQDDDNIRYVESRDRYFLAEDTTWCEYREEVIHEDDAVYVENYGYVHEDDLDEVAVEVDGCYYKIANCVECEISGEWIFKTDAKELPDGRIVTQDEYDKFMAENEAEEEKP
jgi:hypothetical protein